MSLRNWIADYYPETAENIVQRTRDPLDLLDHSLRKWMGLRPDVLSRYGLKVIRSSTEGPVKIVDMDDLEWYLPIDCNSCSLCCAYPDDDCSDCPLLLARGIPCDQKTDLAYIDETRAPFVSFFEDADPEPMIDLIEQARRMILRERTIVADQTMNHLDGIDPEPTPEPTTPAEPDSLWVRIKRLLSDYFGDPADPKTGLTSPFKSVILDPKDYPR